jgi:hypothetical protein
VILEPQDWPVWLGEAPGGSASLLHPSPVGTLRPLSPDEARAIVCGKNQIFVCSSRSGPTSLAV